MDLVRILDPIRKFDWIFILLRYLIRILDYIRILFVKLFLYIHIYIHTLYEVLRIMNNI